MKSLERQNYFSLLNACSGTYTMKIVWEGPRKQMDSMHTFLFANDLVKVWHNVFVKQLPKFAETLGVPLDSSGKVDTSKFRDVAVRLVVEEAHTSMGVYPRVIRIQPLETAEF